MRKTLLVFLALIALAFLWRLSSGASTGTVQPVQATAHTCTPADFSLLKLTASAEGDEAKLTGIITSKCNAAAGVELKWTAFNPDGTVAFSSSFWPASTANIPPQSQYPFEAMNEAPHSKWTYRVEPVSVSIW